MDVLLWWLIPAAGALGAGVWSALAVRRGTGSGAVHDSSGVSRHLAFRAAMERTGRDPGPGGVSGAGQGG
ncbi:hypothetical protein PJ985_04575 [Streptomyces sp. ACA25]|uniref:hypothetical protein n=1 Tax=Streptomyces sp. ACA25 TaxID=3022596 RepID=UPI00230770B0|nr:hypothetical protein [Streptomyces sp. ACA25]MDB1086837.1 hypothetical protein [Streptomyces sp. ACA25]